MTLKRITIGLNRDGLRGITCFELMTQSGEQGIDILVTVVQLGQLLRQVRDPLGKLASVLGDPLYALRQPDVPIPFHDFDVRDELSRHIVELMDQSLDAAAIVFQRQEASLQRLEFFPQVQEHLLRLLELLKPGLGDLCELRQISDPDIESIPLAAAFDAGQSPFDIELSTLVFCKELLD